MIRSVLAAAALAMLLVLTAWNFELRSGLKLAVWTGFLTLALVPALYWLTFQTPHNRAEFKAGTLVILVAAATLGWILVPRSPSTFRYLVTLGLTVLSILGIETFITLLLAARGKNTGPLLLAGLMIIGGVAGMGILLFNSFSVRMYGDDFCYATRTLIQGYTQAVWYFYTHWSGRFSSNFLVMGLAGWRWSTLAQLAVIIVVSYLALRAILKYTGGVRAIFALAGALWLPLAIFSAIPDLYKSLYWIVSSVVVLPVMILIPFYILLIVQAFRAGSDRRWAWAVPVIFLLSFIIATTHEAAVPGWLILQTAAFIWTRVFAREHQTLFILLTVGIAGALAGLIVILVSPGITLRGDAQGYTRVTRIPELIGATMAYFVRFIRSIQAAGWLMLLAVALTGWLVQTGLPRNGFAAVGAAGASLTAGLASFAPGVFAMGEMIPLRTQLIPTAYLVYGIFLTGLLLPRVEGKSLAAGLCAAALVLAPLAGFQVVKKIVPTVIPMRQFAIAWDERDRAARQSLVGFQAITIPWDEWEQELSCTRQYYRTQIRLLEEP